MSDEEITYFAIVGEGKTVDEPLGIVRRRRPANGGIFDEALQRDLEWHRTGIIAEWKRGKFSDELEEVDKETASRIVENFRADGTN